MCYLIFSYKLDQVFVLTIFSTDFYPSTLTKPETSCTAFPCYRELELIKPLPTLQILLESNGHIKDQLNRFLTRVGAHFKTHFQLVLQLNHAA